MSPENQGVFQLLEEVSFRRILASATEPTSKTNEAYRSFFKHSVLSKRLLLVAFEILAGLDIGILDHVALRFGQA